MDFENMDDSSEKKGAGVEDDKAKVMEALQILKPIAEKQGCSVAELVVKYDGSGDSEEETDGDGDPEQPAEGDDKVRAIVARMKASKQG